MTLEWDISTFMFMNTVTYQQREFVYVLLKNIVVIGVCLTASHLCRICVKVLEPKAFINKWCVQTIIQLLSKSLY